MSFLGGAGGRLQNLPAIRIGGPRPKALYRYTLQDTDLEELYHWAPSGVPWAVPGFPGRPQARA